MTGRHAFLLSLLPLGGFALAMSGVQGDPRVIAGAAVLFTTLPLSLVASAVAVRRAEQRWYAAGSLALSLTALVSVVAAID